MNEYYFFLFVTDTSKKLYVLHWASFLASTTGIVMVLIARGHYTIDVLVAYYVSTRVFWIYHTMAHNAQLKVWIFCNFGRLHFNIYFYVIYVKLNFVLTDFLDSFNIKLSIEDMVVPPFQIP